MKNSQKILATLTLVGTLGAATAFAATDEASTNGNGQRFKMNQDRPAMEEIHAAIESGDYEAWAALHEGKEGPFMNMITAENFSKLQEMHQARQDGDHEAAKAIADELGLPKPPAKGNGPSAEMIEAIESGDYDAWVALHEGKEGPMMDIINESNFGKLAEMHEARENGDIEAAKEIADELGLPQRGAKKGMARGMKGQGMRMKMQDQQ